MDFRLFNIIFMSDEYQDYQKDLQLKDQAKQLYLEKSKCPVCLFFQGMSLSGIAFFSFFLTRNNESIRSNYKLSSSLRLFSLFSATLSFWRFSILNKQLRELEEIYS